MWTAAKTLSALRTARPAILRSWQAEARTIYLPWDRKRFTRVGPATRVASHLLDGLIAYHEARTEQDPQGVTAETAPYREEWPTAPEGLCLECCRQMAALSSEWSEVRALLSLLIACTRRKLAQAGADEETLKLSADFLEHIGNWATELRVQSLERELREQQAEAILTQHLIGRRLADASHELRTPLTAVLGFSELLLEESYGPLTPGQKTVIGHIESSAQNLLELVNHLLDQRAL